MERPIVNVVATGTTRDYDAQYNTKVLKANIPFADQVTDENTIYVIRWDFDLGSETTTIPINCVLEFNGGSIKNGTLIGNNTGIIAGLTKIFSNDLDINGRWAVDEYHPEWFGAVTDDENVDCADAINATIVAAGNSYGGIVRLVQGVYNIGSAVILNHKTSLIGSGIGATILKQKEVPNNTHGIVVENHYGCIKIADLTLKGRLHPSIISDNGSLGIRVRPNTSSDTDREQKQYAYSEYNDDNYNGNPTYKWLLIDNVVVTGFSTGLNLGISNFAVSVRNSFFTENFNYGVYWGTSDSSMDNCYINNNGNSGLYVLNGNNKFNNLKVIFNCLRLDRVADGAGIKIENGYRNSFVGCETQDNMCKGFDINGFDNMFINCISNSDCYIDDHEKGYREGYNSYGFYIHGTDAKTNKFVNCEVLEYNYSRYGALYDMPVYCTELYPELYEGIKISFKNTEGLFVSPTYNADNCIPTHNIKGTTIEDISNIKYCKFSSKNISQDFKLPNDLYLYLVCRAPANTSSSVDLFVAGDFKIQMVYNGTRQKFIFQVVGPKNGGGVTAIQSPDIDKDNGSMIVALLHFKSASTISMQSMLKKSLASNYIYFEQENSNFNLSALTSSTIKLNSYINKLVITNRPIGSSYLMPGTCLAAYRSDAMIYLSADNVNQAILNGTFAYGTFDGKPTVANNNIPVGYEYFCTTRRIDMDSSSPSYMQIIVDTQNGGMKIFHKGEDVWVDAFGRVAS